ALGSGTRSRWTAVTPHIEDETRETPKNKEINHARSCFVRTARRAFRGARHPENHQPDGRNYRGFQPHACADLTCGRIAASNQSPNQPRWGTSTAASSRRSEAR